MIYQGAVSARNNRAPVVTGVDPEYTATCEASSDRYWFDRERLNHAAHRAGGIAIDTEALTSKQRRESVFYREVMHGLGIRATAVAVLELKGEMVSCIWFGRTARDARFDATKELCRIQEALPILALGDVVHPKTAPASTLRLVELGLTPREDEIVSYIARGLTNVEIATLLGTSYATVKNQVASILKKCGVANRTELAWRVSEDISARVKRPNEL